MSDADLVLDLSVSPVESIRTKLVELAKLDSTVTQPQLSVPTTCDDNCREVEAELVRKTGSRQALATAVGQAIRLSYDQAYDGQRTGRFHWDQLSKTEKTNAGSLVEIWLARTLQLTDGIHLDFQIAGYEVDCKFSQRSGGWMLPPEVRGHIAMVLTANDYVGRWSLGLIRVTDERVSRTANRDAKSTLNAGGRDAIRWIFQDEVLPPNVLLRIPAHDTVAIMGRSGGNRMNGQQRLDQLFRRAEGLVISRNVIATVAQQEDPMKRVRANGGSRSRLAAEGYLLLGHRQSHREIAADLGLPPANSGEIVSIRLTPAQPDRECARVRIADTLWQRWLPGDLVVPVPLQ